MRRALVLRFVAVMLVVAPRQALALCPNCLGQARNVTPTLELLGLFLLVPFVIAYVVLRRIRRACRDENAGAPLGESELLG